MKRSLFHMRAAVLLALGVLALTLSAWPCAVPVFRYALDNWAPDPYRLTVYTDVDEGVAPADPTLERLWTAARSGRANLDLVFVAPSERPESGAPLEAELHIPAFSFSEGLVWQGTLSDAVVDAMLDSPLRRKVASHILDGVSVVWILLESGRPADDDAAAERLASTLERLEGEIEIPDLGVAPGADQTPLRIDFVMERLRRDDPAERFLVETLLRVEPDLLALGDQPMAFPVFGRGRALYALVGLGINADTIQDACAYLTGPCSCEVKSLNPGLDLLMQADWTTGHGAVPYTQVAAEADLQARAETLADSGRRGTMTLGLAIAVGGLLVINVVAVFALLALRRRRAGG